MIYRKLGNSGLIVSALSLGTMQFGGKGLGNLGQKETDSMVKLALDHGINFIDTADMYARGESETLVGNALKGIREEVVLATKVRLPMSDTNFNNAGTTRVNIIREIDASLRRLKTDYVDLYQVHSWDSNTPLEETLRALDDLVRQGKVRYIGLSNYLAWQAAEALGVQQREHLNRYITAQLYYSLVGRGVEHEWLSLAEYHNIGILVWSPLAGGFLAGKYDRNKPAPQGSRFAEAGRFVPFETDYGYTVVDAVKAVAMRHDASAAQVSIAWLLSRPMISSVIIAARTNERLEENIASVDLKLTAEDFAQLDKASETETPYPTWMVFQHDQIEDMRARVLEPERFANGAPGPVRGGEKW
jgi:aryl-alcohol dehydrogenase-like predicted oxidoreductase